MVAIHYPETRPTNGWTSNQFLIWASGIRGTDRQKWYWKHLNWLMLNDEIKLEIEMARKPGKNSKAKDSEFKGFVNVNLTVERKSAVKGWKKDWEDVITLFSELIADGYRLSFSPANDGEAVQCSVTCRDVRSPNAGWCMTSRAPKWEDALTVAMWKHYVLCDRDWSEYLEGDVEDDWG